MLNSFFLHNGFGLGINTMEGREQKHQQISKYEKKALFQERWKFILRHEFIQLIFLRENGFDVRKYRKRNRSYIPVIQEGHCDSCSLKLVDVTCSICDGDTFKSIHSKVLGLVKV